MVLQMGLEGRSTSAVQGKKRSESEKMINKVMRKRDLVTIVQFRI